MKFFVDTADVDAIRELNDLGMVDGVTTNPSLIAKSGRDIKEVTKIICDMVDGPVSAETVALDAEGMIAEGKELAKIAPNNSGSGGRKAQRHVSPQGGLRASRLGKGSPVSRPPFPFARAVWTVNCRRHGNRLSRGRRRRPTNAASILLLRHDRLFRGERRN
jgi:hypothetical protein